MSETLIEGDATRVADGVKLAYRATTFASMNPAVEGGEMLETAPDGMSSTGVRVAPNPSKQGEWMFLAAPPGFDRTPLDQVGLRTIADELFRRWLALRKKVGATYGKALDPVAYADWLRREGDGARP